MDGSSRSTQSGDPRTQSGLACNICLRRLPNSPVVAYCGHVFCWPCLYRSWPQQGPEVQAGPAISKSCPVCGTALREGFNIVPIYGYDNVALPRSGTERATTTGTTTAAAAAVSNTPIPPRPTAASFFTTTPRRPHSIAARAAAAVSSDTDIPPRPNPPARITQTQMDAADGLRILASTFLGHGELFGFGAGDRLRPSSSPARNIGLGVASRSIRRLRNLRLNLRSMDGNDGSRSESHRARMERVLNEFLEDIGASLALMNVLFDAHDELQDALNRTI